MTIDPYLLIALFTFLEGGEVALLYAGYLLHTYTLALAPVTGIILASVLVSDYLWYRFGALLYGLPLIRTVQKKMGRIDHEIVTHPIRTALIARYSYGLHRLTIARYRMNGIGTPSMLRVLMITATIWLATLGGVIVLFVELIPALKHYMHTLELLVACALIGLFLVEQVGARITERTFVEKNSTEGTDAVHE